MRDALRQALRFGAVGMVNTAVGLGTIWGAMALGAAPLPANAIGYGVGLCVSFLLNRAWTFRRAAAGRGGGTLGEAGRFLAAFALAWSLNAGVVWALLRITAISPYLLQVAGMATYTITFFLLCRAWVFAAPRGPVAGDRDA